MVGKIRRGSGATDQNFAESVDIHLIQCSGHE